jgi:uncharacterized phage protein (predicted DNA packaging)
MKWLSISDIKKHSRIDYDCEDALLELYADAAEEMVMQITGRDYDNIIATYGDIPAALRQAALILVDTSFMQRTAVSAQNLYAVPYAFDFLIKPFMKLTVDEEEPEPEPEPEPDPEPDSDEPDNSDNNG